MRVNFYENHSHYITGERAIKSSDILDQIDGTFTGSIVRVIFTIIAVPVGNEK